MTDQEHFDRKKRDCPCREHIYAFRSGGWICKATSHKECKLENCPFYYWVAFARR